MTVLCKDCAHFSQASASAPAICGRYVEPVQGWAITCVASRVAPCGWFGAGFEARSVST